ncbi:hypothetical protein GCM10010222_65340 [Streptomyces tanashiensis]|nr:hypothetical protein GCM10010222_65340 [Streptomyces tanashiensis]
MRELTAEWAASPPDVEEAGSSWCDVTDPISTEESPDDRATGTVAMIERANSGEATEFSVGPPRH